LRQRASVLFPALLAALSGARVASSQIACRVVSLSIPVEARRARQPLVGACAGRCARSPAAVAGRALGLGGGL